MQNGTRLAAVDLGSNSFRLEIGQLDHGQIHRTEYHKETVRQGNGLDADKNLTLDAMQRGWDCLARFGERLAGFKTTEVRAVATQTLREARNRDDFLAHATELLGFPIDVISGREEARLIYQGVAHLLPQSDERRLVIDIGGRSTELILGQHLTARVMESYRVGSVAWSMKYFPNSQLTASAFKTAEIAAKAVLDETLNTYHRDAWDVAYGSSGTMGAVADVLTAAGWPEGIVTRDGLEWLVDKLIKSQHADRVRLLGLKEDRRAVIGGGVSVLRAVFDLLSIDHLYPAQGALRHGVLYDLLDREDGHSDLRASSVKRLANNFGVDIHHATRVTKIATALFTQLQTDTRMFNSTMNMSLEQLTWTAQLHEIGNQISHSEYHKHGAYILENADISGFAKAELHRLGMLILGQRGKLKKLDHELEDTVFTHQLLSLRLAVILCHARRDIDTMDLQLVVSDKDERQFNLSYPPSWSKKFPQSVHLLHEEEIAWSRTNWALQLQVADS
jgi:exopolyphosphatase / guanosine-5'-triphosphate,3'-diphosphate pyrophosphatase